MDNGYNIETCKIIGAASLSLHFCHMQDFFRSSEGGGAWPKWPNGKYAYGRATRNLYSIGKIYIALALL